MTIRSLLHSFAARPVRSPSHDTSRPSGTAASGRPAPRQRMDAFDAPGPSPRRAEDTKGLKHPGRAVGTELREAADEARRNEKLDELGEALRARMLRESLRDAGRGEKLEDLGAALRQHALREALGNAGCGEKLEDLGAALRQHALREALGNAGSGEKLEDLGAALRQRALREALGNAKRGEKLEDLGAALRQHALREALGNAGSGEKLEDLGAALRQHALREALGDPGRDEQMAKLEALLLQHAPRELGAQMAEALRNSVPPGLPEAPTTDWQVQPGDTVGDISWSLMQQGVPGPVEDIARQIVELNGLENPDLIHAGSTLQVPA
ncbi:LysM peptidoglycan-binding domain-containing protein, partial [Myxococcus llanfairpwllgwyngyllgogerychwyrndrobwllllantysiliogogogochensis]